MAGTDVKNDIKILFFIINSINALVPGIFIFSFGVTYAIRPTTGQYISIASTAGGLVLLAVAALGYAGAVRQNMIMLSVYTGITVLVVIVEIVLAVMIRKVLELQLMLMLFITLICLGLLGGSLAAALAVQGGRQPGRGPAVQGGRPGNRGMILSPPPAAYTPVV